MVGMQPSLDAGMLTQTHKQEVQWQKKGKIEGDLRRPETSLNQFNSFIFSEMKESYDMLVVFSPGLFLI